MAALKSTKKYFFFFLFIHAISACRVASELAFFDYEFRNSLYQNLRFYLENDYYFLIGVFAVPALVAWFAKAPYESALSLTVKLFPLIILAPWVDHFFAGRATGYENAEVTPGILFQVVLIIGSASLYTLWKTRHAVQAALCGLFTYLLLWFFAMPEFVFSPQLNFASDTFLQFYYFIPFLFGAAVFFRWNDPESYEALKDNLRPLKFLEGLVPALAGAAAVYFAGFRVHEVHVVHAAIAAFLLRSIPPKRIALNAAAVLTFVILSFAFTLGWEAFFLGVAGTAIALAPPFGPRLERVRGGLSMLVCYFIALYGVTYTPLKLGLAMAAWGSVLFVIGARLQALRTMS